MYVQTAEINTERQIIRNWNTFDEIDVKMQRGQKLVMTWLALGGQKPKLATTQATSDPLQRNFNFSRDGIKIGYKSRSPESRLEDPVRDQNPS